MGALNPRAALAPERVRRSFDAVVAPPGRVNSTAMARVGSVVIAGPLLLEMKPT